MLDILLGFIMLLLSNLGLSDVAVEEDVCSALSDSSAQVPCPPPSDSSSDDENTWDGLIKVGGSGLIKVGGSG